MQSVTLHTNVGELKCEIFCDEVPKTAEVCVSLHSPSSSVSLSNSFFLSLYLMRPQQQAVIWATPTLLLSCAVLSFFFVLCSVYISGCDLSLSFSLLLVQSSLMRPAVSSLALCFHLFFPLVFFLVSLCVWCLLLVFGLLLILVYDKLVIALLHCFIVSFSFAVSHPWDGLLNVNLDC